MFLTLQCIILTPGLKIAITRLILTQASKKDRVVDIIPTNSCTKYNINLKETAPYSLNSYTSNSQFLTPQSIILTPVLPKQ